MAGGGPILRLIHMSRPKLMVRRLEDALDRDEDYEGAHSWRVAPLQSMSGARSWHVPSADGRRWVKVDEPDAVIPGLEVDADELPDLPPCRQRMWAFIFVDDKGKPIKPEMMIGGNDTTEAEPVVRPKGTAKAETLSVFNTSLAQANSDARAAQKVANDSINAVVGHYKDLLDLRKQEFDRLRAEHDGLKAAHAKLQEENTACLVAMAELCNRSDFAETIRHLFGERPELLVGAVKDLAGGLMKAIGGNDTKPRIGGKGKPPPTEEAIEAD